MYKKKKKTVKKSVAIMLTALLCVLTVLPPVTVQAASAKPTVTASAASNVNSTTCTLNGSITDNGLSTITDYGFYLDVIQSIRQNDPHKIQLGTNDYTGSITMDRTGLIPGLTYYYQAYATNSYGTTYSNILSVTMAGANSAITSADNTVFHVGSQGSFTVIATGDPVPSLSETGALPVGVSFTDNGDGTATLSGKPANTTDGSYPITIKASNGATPDATQNFTLTVALPTTTYFAGSGTEADPWLIQSAADLAQMRDLVNSQTSPWADAGVYYKLTADIDLSAYASDTINPVKDDDGAGTGWTPIGRGGIGAYFKGVFDGSGKSISGLTIFNSRNQLLGLFGVIEATGIVKNLGVVKCEVTGLENAGGLAGYCSGTIENCHATGRVQGGGGLVGKLSGVNGGYIKNCYTVCSILNGGGGIVGYLVRGTITNCYSAGVINAPVNRLGGGIAGSINESTIRNCVALQMKIDGGLDTYGQPHAGRIWGDDYSSFPNLNLANFSGNYAWSGMTGLSAYIPGSPTDGDKNGANLDTAADCVAAINNIGFTSFTEADLPKYFTGYFTGSGTESDPYQISTVDDLENLPFAINNGVNFDGKFFKLMNDIDLRGSFVNWEPIGSDFKKSYDLDTYEFNGTFDGNGKVISHLNYSRQELSNYFFGWYYMGLFGNIGPGGTVKNLSLTDVSISGHNYFTGGIAGKSEGPIDNCQVSGSIQSTGYTTVTTGQGLYADPDTEIGGIVGRGVGPGFKISNCHVTGNLGNAGAATDLTVGGVAGVVALNDVAPYDYQNQYDSGQAGQVTDSSFKGDIYAHNSDDFQNRGIGDAGGLIGGNQGTVTVLNCHTEGTVKAGNAAGLIYAQCFGLIQNCYSTSTVTSDYGNAFGFIGYGGYGLIQNCYSTGQVSGGAGAYGFMGRNGAYGVPDANGIITHYIYGTVKNCYSTGQVSGGAGACGFMLQNIGTVEYCCATGDVTGNGQYVAGFMGENRHLVGNDGVTANCYYTGAVSGTTIQYCGGFAAVNYSVTPIQNCIALNPSISGTCAYVDRFVGRIVSNSQIPSQISDCYAWSGMTINGSTVTGTPTDTKGGDLADWTDVRPKLVAIGFKNVPRPAHIPLGASTAPAVTSADNAAFTVGSAGTFTVTTTGTPAASLTETGALPSGVTFSDNNDGTATISGTPGTGTAGSYPLTITAANGVSPDATQSFTLTVALPTTTYFAGRGTEADPWLIQSAADLAQLAALVNSQTSPWADAGVYYKLTANIDLSAYASAMINFVPDPLSPHEPVVSGTGWTPIGYGAYYDGHFNGVFDGNGKTVSGLYINYPDGSGYGMGLFGKVFTTAVVKNLGVVKCDVTGRQQVGGLAGTLWGGIIENCYATGRVNCDSGCGGLVGNFYNNDKDYKLANGYIKNCYAVCTVNDATAGNGGGGLVNNMDSGTITNCYSAGAVFGDSGGIVANVYNNKASSTVKDCVALQLRNAGYYGYDTGDPSAHQGRIWSSHAPDNSSGNYAWSGMTGLSSISPSDSGKDGATLDTAAACVAAIRNIGFTDFTEADLPAYITGYFTGSGTEPDPYQISTVDDLENLAFDVNNGVNFDGKYFKLMNDIDLAGSYMNWMPIGSDRRIYNADDTYKFNGIFDGNGKTIRHLSNSAGYGTVVYPYGGTGNGYLAFVGQYYMGLFGCVGDLGTVKNLSLADVSLSGYNYYVGGIAGECDGVIDNCHVSGSIQTRGYSVRTPGDTGSGPRTDLGYEGGIVGAGVGSELVISNCSATGQIGSVAYLVGPTGGSYVGAYYAGGVAGMVIANDGLTDYYTAGQAGLVTNSSFSGDVFQSANYSGGLIGVNYATVTNCHAEGSVQGAGTAAGLIGNSRAALIENCYSTCAVSSSMTAAGFIGANGYLVIDTGDSAHPQYIGGTIRNCYSTGQVTCNRETGGAMASAFLSANNGTVEYCYTTGNVSGTGQIASFVGINRTYNDSDGIANCYCTGIVSGPGPAVNPGSSFGNCAFAAVNYSRIQNCIALNPSISGAEAYTYLGRMVGRTVGANSSLIDNYAFGGMTVNGSAVTGTTTDSNGGDLADWTEIRPVLAAIGFKNVPRPSYIGLGASTAPTVTSADNATFTAGSPGTFTVTTTGTPAASIFLTGTTPVGVTFTDNNDGTATISGTPDAGTAGSYPVTITATNGVGTDATQSFTLTVNPNVNAVKLDTPSGLAWDNATPGKATWDAVSNASSYTVQLIKDTATYVDAVTTGAAATYYDFTSEIAYEGAGSYTFSVTAAGDGIDYINSDTQTVGTPYSYTGQTKTIIVGIQNGIITAGTGGSATFAAITTNIADGTAVTAGWYDAGGNPATTPVGLSYSASNIASNASTITVTADATSIAGTYYFKAVSNGTASGVVTVVINAAGDTRSSAKAITAFSIGGVAGTISETNHTIAVTLPYGTNITNLTPSVTVSDKAGVSPASGTAQNFTSPVTYTVTAENDTSQSYIVTVTVAADTRSSAKAITAFSIGGIAGIINETNHSIAVTLPYGTNITNLTPSVTVSDKAGVSPASGTAQNFTSPVTYTVTAENGTSQSYTVTVTVAADTRSSAKAITAFSIGGVAGTISETNSSIAVTLPYGTSIASLTPSVTVSGKAGVSPASGTAQNFTSPVTYTVTAENGTSQSYTVTVTVAADTRSSAKAITAFSIGGVAGTISETNRSIAVTLPYGTSIASLTPSVTVSGKAGVSPASGTAQNFTSPVTYTVTAENGTSQSYTVTVTVAAAPVVNKVLQSVTTPSAITGVANGTAKAAGALGLPATVTIVTDGGNVQANVTWDAAGSSYDAASKAAQTFIVNGTVELPSGVVNTNSVLLTAGISVSVNAAAPIAPSITTTSLPGGTAGTAYSQALAATGDTPVTWSIVGGTLPSGLSLSGSTISGTPTASGTFGFTVKAANSAGNVTKALSITIAAAPAPPAGEYTPPPAPPKQEKPKVETTTSGDTVTATTATTATTDGSGKATAAVTQAQVSEAVGKAVSEAAKQGNDAAAIVEIKVTASGNAKSVETSIPKAAVSEMAHNDKVDLKVSTPVADITFGKDALDTISGQAGEDVRISAAKADVAVLPAETRQVVGDRPVYNFSVASGDRTISQFNGNVTVAVPYTPEPGEDTDAIVIYYINAGGKPETVSNCHYNPATGCVSFTTTHFSTYVVGYNKVDFKDVPADAWYGEAVGFIAARGITTGTGSGNFSPAAKLTRGEFLVMMMRAYGIAPDKNPADNFADAGSAYYTGYLAAAKRLGISGGVGNNMFAPGMEITRQEMFTLLFNTLKTMGQLPQSSSGKRLTDFTDAGQVASWAKDAMTLFVRSGIIDGSSVRLNPAGIAARAEMAQVLYNLLSK
jgi:hypothetical protein